MQEFVNRFSDSGTVVAGMMLASGATLRKTDIYDSTTGQWEEAGAWAGAIIRPDCETVWVRPNAELSADAVALLSALVRDGDQHFYLVEDSWHWKVVPEPCWASDGRMDWAVQHPECIDEFIDFGLVGAIESYHPGFEKPYPLYYPTALGIELVRSARSTH